MYYLKKAVYLIVLIGYSVSYAGSYDDFFSALGRDNVAQVKNLLRRGFDANSVGPTGEAGLVMALRLSSFKVAQLLIEHPATQIEVRTAKDESPLMLAAIKGQLELCQLLISRDADVNKPGWTPLHYAASGGSAAVVQLLLAHYAYVDAESPNGSTPLMLAAQYGSPESIQALLAAGADPTLKNKLGLTALDFVRKSEHPDSEGLIVRALGGKTVQGAW
jgi:ankyrin repeat protein